MTVYNGSMQIIRKQKASSAYNMETKVHGLEYPGNTLNVFSTVKSGHAINVSKKRLIEIASIIPNRKNGINRSAFSFFPGAAPVSYTHLDVYKRQEQGSDGTFPSGTAGALKPLNRDVVFVTL